MRRDSPELRKRLDTLLLDLGLLRSRSRSQELILAGKVMVNGEICLKPGMKFPENVEILLDDAGESYVSRGGLKLKGAIEDLKITLTGKSALDVGASTGGFTDYLLQNGISLVFCVDVGKAQLVAEIRQNPRVCFWESTNIKDFSPTEIGANIGIIVVDLSFISLTKVIPHLAKFLTQGGELLALIKPQFEVGKSGVGKNGIVKDAAKREAACKSIATCCVDSGFAVKNIVSSKITGADGNQEFFIYAIKR